MYGKGMERNMDPLTPNQRRVLGCLKRWIEERGYAPTLDEAAERLGISKPTVQQYLRALEQKGAISRGRYAHRSIRIIAQEEDAERGGLPLVGLIAAGEPIEALEDAEQVRIEEVLGFDREMPLFLLRVKGDSMIGDGIFDGDYVVIEKRETAGNGELVVALLPDNTATLKRFYRERGRIRLQPANPAMKPIYVGEVAIQGVVKGVVRAVR